MFRLRHLSGAIVAAIAFSTAVQAGTTDFDHMVVIGDSLSDNGNLSLASGAQQPSRFTTNPGKVAVENIADHYGLALTPSVAGGNDYAFGGARVDVAAGGGAVPSLTAQWAGYLAAAGGHADARTLYSVWGGANDIFYYVQAAAIGASTPQQTQAGVATAAQQELALLGSMHAAGARYALVFNLPDIGKTPAAALQGPAAQQALAQLSLLYNGTLDGGLNQLSDQGLNVVPVDVYALFNEVIAEPSKFGFDNVTTPACGTGSTSLLCGPQGSGAPYTYAAGTDQSYLFADGVHPTTAAHAMLAQYVIAELNAPGQVSLLAEAPLAAAHAHLGILREQMRIDDAGGATRLFAGIRYGKQRRDATSNSPKADSRNVNLALGVDVATGDHFNVGAALGLARDHADIAGNAGGYRLDSIIASGYARWHRGGGYLGAHVGFAQLSYNDVDRRFPIGGLLRTETAQTDGSQLLAGIGGGFRFGAGGLQTGPFARLQWQRVRVDGFSEDGDDSSAMWFGRQQRDALVATLGWQIEGHWKVGNATLRPWLSAGWNHDSEADPRPVRAGLSGMPGSFALTGYLPDSGWASADLGLSADLGDATSTWVAYHGRFADSHQRLDSFTIGFKVAF